MRHHRGRVPSTRPSGRRPGPRRHRRRGLGVDEVSEVAFGLATTRLPAGVLQQASGGADPDAILFGAADTSRVPGRAGGAPATWGSPPHLPWWAHVAACRRSSPRLGPAASEGVGSSTYRGGVLRPRWRAATEEGRRASATWAASRSNGDGSLPWPVPGAVSLRGLANLPTSVTIYGIGRRGPGPPPPARRRLPLVGRRTQLSRAPSPPACHRRCSTCRRSAPPSGCSSSSDESRMRSRTVGCRVPDIPRGGLASVE